MTESHRYITFKLGNELFAVNVTQVLEILEVSAITKVPTAPDFIRGVVNVRGKAIPVADLRLRFGLPPAPETVNTRIIVMELELNGEATTLGGIADSVDDVLDLDPSEIGPPPSIATRWRTEFILGLGRRNDDFIIILNINAIFKSDELAVVSEIAAPESELTSAL